MVKFLAVCGQATDSQSYTQTLRAFTNRERFIKKPLQLHMGAS